MYREEFWSFIIRILCERVNIIVSILFIGSFLLLISLTIWRSFYGDNPIADGMAALMVKTDIGY